MSAEPTRCPKCNGEMVQGFIFDVYGGKVENWMEGAPKRSFWSGTGGAKISADKCIPVGVFRCSACGFLESYARAEFAPKPRR
jgi:hypothetical protein